MESKVRIGDKVRKCVTALYGETPGNHPETKRTGTVIYIHPKGRFYTVAFPVGSGIIRECYLMTE